MKMNRVMAAITTALATVSIAAEAQTDTPEVHWSIESGLGYQTNAYHAPDHDYADYYADPTGATIVSPEEKGGAFIPLKLKAELLNPVSQYTDLVASYRFSGSYFPDSALNDASSTDHKINIGADTQLGKNGDKGDAYAGVFVRSYDKVYVDHDSGEPKTSATGVDVSDRYSYQSFGIEGDYERKLGRNNSVGVKGEYEKLDYSDTGAWSEYDHTHTMLAAFWEHRLVNSTKVTLQVSKQMRDYNDRPAYNIDGSLFASNPTLTYDYTGYEVGLRHRFNDSTVAYADFELLQRSDNHEGYNDMDKSSVKVRLIHDFNEKMRLRAKVKYYERDYLNAYNFEDPTQGSKSASGSDVQLRGEYRRNDNKLYYLELEHSNRDNTDDRYQYNNEVVALGAKWEY